jgi:hypothetical protein
MNINFPDWQFAWRATVYSLKMRNYSKCCETYGVVVCIPAVLAYYECKHQQLSEHLKCGIQLGQVLKNTQQIQIGLRTDAQQTEKQMSWLISKDRGVEVNPMAEKTEATS